MNVEGTTITVKLLSVLLVGAPPEDQIAELVNSNGPAPVIVETLVCCAAAGPTPRRSAATAARAAPQHCKNDLVVG